MVNGSLHAYFPSKRGIIQGNPLSPLLIFICMEYLSRTLKKIGAQLGFQYHPRCAAMKLTHLCFANDILLCCKGEFSLVYLMLRGFQLFSRTSGLQANT